MSASLVGLRLKRQRLCLRPRLRGKLLGILLLLLLERWGNPPLSNGQRILWRWRRWRWRGQSLLLNGYGSFRLVRFRTFMDGLCGRQWRRCCRRVRGGRGDRHREGHGPFRHGRGLSHEDRNS